jgi:Fcf2 pre-rRNA processing
MRISNKEMKSMKDYENKEGHSITSNDIANSLTKLIPNYTAPLRLNGIDPSNRIEELRRSAIASETSHWRLAPSVPSSAASRLSAGSSRSSSTATNFATAVVSFKHGHIKKRKGPTMDPGKGWFHMVPSPMTEDLKRDLIVLKNRNYLDPKRFYKKEPTGGKNKNNTFVQVGTVIEGTGEFFSSRITNKNRRSNLTEEIMSDKRIHDYTVGKFKEMSAAKQQRAEQQKKRSKRARF